MENQTNIQNPFGVDYHQHNGVDSPQLDPINFLGFKVIIVADATVSPIDKPANGTIRFLTDGTNYILWAYISNKWKSAVLT